MKFDLPIPDYSFINDMTFAEPLPAARIYADTQFDILKQQIQDFEKSLDNDHEVGLMLTNLGTSVTMVVQEITYREPVIMIFKGNVNGSTATLIQHVNQLNFLLLALPKDPQKPKRQIGFLSQPNS